MNTTNTTIIDKITKLLNLAKGKGATPAEAASAAAQASRLMLKYNIEQTQLESEREEAIEDDALWRGSRILTWLRTLASGVARSNGCRILLYSGSAYGIGKHAYISIIGPKSGIEVSRYMFVYLQREINRLTKEQTQLQSRAYKNAFRVGAASEVTRRLIAENEQTRVEIQSTQAGSTALVRIDQTTAKVELAVKARSGGTYHSAGVSDARGQVHGKQAARSIAIHKGLDGKPIRQLS